MAITNFTIYPFLMSDIAHRHAKIWYLHFWILIHSNDQMNWWFYISCEALFKYSR